MSIYPIPSQSYCLKPKCCHKPWIDGATEGTKELDAEDVEDEREDCDHLEEEEEAGGKCHCIPTPEVV